MRARRALRDVGEWGLLKWLYDELGKRFGDREDVAIGIGDDTAVLNIGAAKQIAITTDAIVEGVHFERAYATPYDLGWKALAVNLSDMAAMFSKPAAAFVSLALPCDIAVSWVHQFYHGMIELATNFGVAIVGGDTSSSEKGIFISVSVVGWCEGKLPRRSNAKPGDLIIVTGTLGDSAIGLLALQRFGRKAVMRSKPLRWLATRHLRPVPRVREGMTVLSTGLCECAIDLSDGLVSDLERVAEMSDVRICLSLESLPISQQAISASKLLNCSPIEMALYGGEDYELAMFVPAEHARHVCNAVESTCNVRCSIVGSAEAGKPGVYGIDEHGRLIKLVGGYEHFKS